MLIRHLAVPEFDVFGEILLALDNLQIIHFNLGFWCDALAQFSKSVELPSIRIVQYVIEDTKYLIQ